MNSESGFQLADLAGIVRRRRGVMLATSGLVVLASYWIAMALPNEYESYATILVQPQAISKELIRGTGGGQSDLTERLQLMTAQILARPRLSRIIDQLGLYEEESKNMVRAKIIDLMRQRVRVKPVIPELETGVRRQDKEINTFRIYFRDDDPLVAREVAQRLANDFIEKHISERVSISRTNLEFIADELDRISGRMRSIEAEIAEVKGSNPGVLPDDVQVNQRRLERVLSDLARVRSDLDHAKSEEAFWLSQLSNAREGRRNDDADPSRKLQLLELQLDEYQALGFTDKHPDVIKTRMELEKVRETVERRRADGEAVDLISTEERTALANVERARRQALQAGNLIQALEAESEKVRALLAETPRVAEQLDALTREYRSQSSSYQTYIVRQQEASVSADMERRQLGEQFRVLEAAFAAPDPTSPNRALIIVLGSLFGIGLGGGLAMAFEVADPSVHTPQQLQSVVGIPVLASIPQILLEADRRAQRRRRIRRALASVAVALFALVGGAANYVWVNGSIDLFGTGAGAEEASIPSEEEDAPRAPQDVAGESE